MHNALLCPARKPAFCGKVCIPLPALLRLNSLRQSLTALTAPSKREPLAYPQTLCPNWKLYRHAKGPILEGAGCDQREQTGGVFLHDPSCENEIAERPQTLRYLEIIAIQLFNATATALNCISQICCLTVALISCLAIKIIFPADYAQSARGGHFKSSLLLRHRLQRRLLQVGD